MRLLCSLTLFTLLVAYGNAQEDLQQFGDSIIPKNLNIERPTTLYESSKNGGMNEVGVLNPGDQATIEAIDQRGPDPMVRTTVNSGPNSGRSAWTKYPRNEDQRTSNFENESGSTITPRAGSNHSFLDRIKKTSIEEFVPPFNNYFQHIGNFLPPSNVPGVNYARNLDRDLMDAASDEEIWEDASSDQPRYKPDIDKYDGGDYLPFYREGRTAKGHEYRRYYYVKYDPKKDADKIMKFNTSFQEAVTERRQSRCQEERVNVDPSEPSGQWLNGCQVLDRDYITRDMQQDLITCAKSIKAAIKQGGTDRTNLFKNLYKKLNPKEQVFAAHIFTSIGEARGEGNAERVMVMKVLNNRARHAKERGFRNVNELDIALQYKQFSMYNDNDPNWRTTLLGDGLSNVNKAVNSFIIYKNTEFPDEHPVHEIYHYHTRGVNPDWSRGKSEENVPEINGERAKTHRFFRNIAWSFSHNNFSGKSR